MAKKKKQCAPVNPELTKVKSVFQRNVDMAYKVQRTHKSDFVERYDLTDVYCKRRIKAVMNLLPKFKERYGKQYPELEMEEDLANIASLPVMTYDSIERSTSLCLVRHSGCLTVRGKVRPFWKCRTFSRRVTVALIA